MNSNEEALYANRSLCYKNLQKYKMSLYDLNKAIDINPKNIKYLKRLVGLHTLYGNFGDCVMILQKCVNLEPKDSTHKTELKNMEKLISDYESIDEKMKKNDFKEAEEKIGKILKESSEFLSLKITYVKVLIENLKLIDAINFLVKKFTTDEKTDECDYLLALAFYYDGQ